MIYRCIVAALVAVMSAGLVVPAFAQEQIPAAKQQDPSPENPVQKSYENGKIIVGLISDRHYAHHLGEKIQLRLVISTHPGVRLNYEMVTRGIFQAAGSDFELVAPPVVRETTSNGRRLVVIDLTIRSWVIKQTLVFNADIAYAVELAADARTPVWKVLTSPDFVVTTSNTATDSENALIESDQSTQVTPVPQPVWPMRVLGAILILGFPAICALALYRRVFPARVVPANELAWRVFDRVAKQSRFGSFTPDHVQELAHALRHYLQVESVPVADLKEPLADFFAGQPHERELTACALACLAKMDRVLYSRHSLTAAECQELMENIQSLVPRP